MHETFVRPRNTSWGSVLGGWFAALGALAILFPIAALAAGLSPAAQASIDDPTLAFPLVLALFVSWLIGGYVAGRMAVYRRSWHGLMSAVWGLFVGLVVALIAGGTAGLFANAAASLPRLDMSSYANATVFGFVLGIAGVILGGWLGGVLSPAPVAIVEREPARAPIFERRPPVMPVRAHEPARAQEPTFWERLTGKRHGDIQTRSEAPEGETLVPPAQRRAAEHDGDPRREEEVRR